MKRRWQALAALLSMAVLVGCSEHAEQTVARSVSPLIGTWIRDGATSRSPGTTGPQFTQLTFAADGSLKANYVAAGIGAALGTSPSVKAENDTYATPDASTLSIAEGTTHLTYSYRVSGSKLYLTPSGTGDAAVFTKASS